jgi:flagellar biosynthesis/type III secretory pathway protein FliH
MDRLSLLSCGRCGKPRGLTHVCTGRRRGPKFRLGVTFTCATCSRRHGNPLTHKCVVKSDFRQRKAAQERAVKAERRRRRRKAAAARRRATAKARREAAAERRKEAARAKRKQQQPSRPASHDRTRHAYQTCADLDCSRHPCRVYREGSEAGETVGYSKGYSAGYAEGMQAALERTG